MTRRCASKRTRRSVIAQRGRRGIVCAAGLLLTGVFLTVSWGASSCEELSLIPTPPDYYLYPEYSGRCPDGSGSVRCYRYHWDWICEKGDLLFWDRRLEAAAHAACGCPPPPGITPASPAVSGRPREGIFSAP